VNGPGDGHGRASLPADIPAVGSTIAGRYEVVSLLGVGGMGVVVAARHRILGHQVAIKFMRADGAQDQNAVERFLREARAAVALSSEHVARVIDVATLETGAPYMVMEYLAGEDLGQVLQRNGPLATAAAVDMVLQGCEAIAEAHRLGIIHRDLKPSNLFLARRSDGSSLVKVLDFGISKAADSTGGNQVSHGLTASGMIMGSPGYMSPEQIRSTRAVDARSDIWSLGVILYELLAGISPFQGETMGDTFAKITSEDPPPLRDRRPDVPAALDAVIRRCLERKAAARIQSVEELASALQPFALPRASAAASRGPASGVGANTLIAPESFPAAAESGLGTERPWLRSGAKPSQAPRRHWIVMLVAAGLLASGVGFVVRRTGSEPAAPSALPAARPVDVPTPTPGPSTTAEASPPPVQPDTPPPAATVEAPAPVGSVAGTPRVHRDIAAPKPTRPGASAAEAPRPPEATASAAPTAAVRPPAHGQKDPSDCSPPYIIDSAGHREYKPECL
jgi:eukaryotic-like serine/threonine-protein kinase